MKIKLILILLLFACNKKESINRIDTILLTEELSPIDSIKYEENVNPFFPFNIININEKYLVLSQRTQDKFLRVYSLPDLKLLYDWGKSGRGPAEFIMPPFFINTTSENNFIILNDLLDYRQEIYGINDTTLYIVESKELRYENQSSLLERVRFAGDEKYIVDNYPVNENDDYEYLLLELDNPLVQKRFGEYPIKNLEPEIKSRRFIKSSGFNLYTGNFIAFYMRYNSFKIYDVEKNLIDEFFVDGFTPNSYEEDPNDYLTRLILQTTEKRIYTIGYFESSTKIFDEISSENNSSFETWDWNGQSLFRIKFDRLIHGFSVSEKYRKIYAYSLSNPEQILVYELPNSIGK